METKNGLTLRLKIRLTVGKRVAPAIYVFKMNQMEHNVKIKDYKKDINTGPLENSLQLLNYRKDYPAHREQRRMMERFKDFHWERQNVLTIGDHGDRMYVLRHHANDIEDKQYAELKDYQQHRMKYLEGIKDNITSTRERFYRRSELDRKINHQEHGLNPETKPLYKIINDGVPIRF